MLSPTQQKKLQDLQELREPSMKAIRMLKERAVAKATEKSVMMKGEPGKDGKDGKTPMKGVDYFTKKEVEDLIKYLESRVVKHGKNGLPGKNGKDGETPVRGTHYFNKQDKEEIKLWIASMIPEVKDGISPKIEDIIKEIKKNTISYTEIKDAPDLNSLKKLIEYLKLGGFRGGGPNLKAGSNITLTKNSDGTTSISSSGGGGGSGYQSCTGTVNGTNKVFVFSTAPNVVSVDGVPKQVTQSDGTVNWTGTTTITLSIAPVYDIFGVA